MRTFRLTSPLMHGHDVAALQRDVNHHMKAWGVPGTALLKVDGQYGRNTRRRMLEVAFGLGLDTGYIDKHGCTVNTQRKIYGSMKLSAAERKRQHGRTGWRHRYAHRFKVGPDAAAAWAYAMARRHIVEHPMGSNSGPYITDWERLTGYGPGVFWCGCFANAALVAGGMHPHNWMGFVPFVEAHAREGWDGWRWHSPGATPQKGWLACFAHGDHIELVVESGHPLRTVGGNTSAGNGSPNNGGGVFAHNFDHYRGLPLDGFAAPNWH